MLIAAVGREQITMALSIAARNGLAVFATLDDRLMGKVKAVMDRSKGTRLPVYFYETG